MNLGFPLHFDGRGRSAEVGDDEHVRDLLEQLLFTHPGERVNRPDFGSGLMQLVFAPNSPELAATLQFTAQAALQRYLGDVIEVETLEVLSEDAKLMVEVHYLVRRSQERRSEHLERVM